MKHCNRPIYRLPVIISDADPTPLPNQMPRQPMCVDFDPMTGERIGTQCRDRFHNPANSTKKDGVDFVCPNYGRGPLNCSSATFLYPRRFKSETDHHFHQGIDIAGGHFNAPIVSVCDGTVVRAAVEYVPGVGGYGRTIVVMNDERTRWYLYAHCYEVRVRAGQRVAAGHIIGTVGISDTRTWRENGRTVGVIFNGTATNRSHLHFEVSASEYWKAGFTKESRPDDFTGGSTGKASARLNPFEELAALGPWGTREVFMPNSSAALNTARDFPAPLTYVETSPRGGQFPLGANNTWHGGVHLETKPAAQLRAPFDGEIVALRLDPDPTRARTEVGDTNFILMRHEISEVVASLMLGKPLEPPTPGKPTPKPAANAVGRNAENPPERVLEAKARLHAVLDASGQPYYAPAEPAALTDGAADEAFCAAIEAFQDSLPRPHTKKGKPVHKWPDGVMTVDGPSWKALFKAATPPLEQAGTPEGDDGGTDPEPPPPRKLDPKRTVYSILMHLGARRVDAAMAGTFEWLKRAQVPPRAGNEDDDAIAERRADAEHAKRGIGRRVGCPPANDDDLAADHDAGDTEDIRWVQERLVRLDDWSGEPDGVWSSDLRDAVAAFQRRHVEYYADPTHVAPGYVEPKRKSRKSPKSETLLALQRTRAEQDGDEFDDVAGVDPVLLARLRERDDAGRARVLSGLSIRVKSGEPLWISGVAQGYDGPEALALFEQVHWGLFSQHPLLAWESLVDETDDLDIDLPAAFFDRVEQDAGGVFVKDKWLVPAELAAFYGSERSEFLRRTMCKFRSEWSIAPAAWRARLAELDIEIPGLEDDLAPFSIWGDAADVLPPSPHVWHYNPIAFLGRYADLLAALAPKPLGPPAAPAQLRVRVRFADGQPWSYAHVALAYYGLPPRLAETGADGVAIFGGMAKGSGVAWLDETEWAVAFFDLDAGEDEELELTVDIAGPTVTVGRLQLSLLDADGYAAAWASVTLLRDGAFFLETAVDGDGQLTLELPPGNYTVSGVDDEAVIGIFAGGEFELVLRSRELGELAVRVHFSDGTPAAGHAVELVGVATRDTDATGSVGFERLLPGEYLVRVVEIDDARASVTVAPRSITPVALVIALGDIEAPSTDAGALDVFVHDDADRAVADAELWLLDDAQLQLLDATTDDAGRVVFEDLAPGTYGVSIEGGEADALGLVVTAGARTRARVCLGGGASVGAVDVFVVTSDGFTAADVLVHLVDAQGFERAPVVTDAAGLASFEEVPAGTWSATAEHIRADAEGIVVTAGARASAVLTRKPVAPKPKPEVATGTLDVTIIYSDGQAVSGTVKVTDHGYRRIASSQLAGHEGGHARFDGLAAGRYYVYLDGFDAYAIDAEVVADQVVPVMILLPA